MKSFKQYTQYQESFVENAIAEATQEYLIESSTADATNTEMAICLAYNMKRIQDADTKNEISMPELFAQGLDKAGIKSAKWKKVTNQKELLAIGNKVTADSKMAWGDYLSHAGSSDESTNYYASKYGFKAGDTTSKSDFVSTTNSDWNISLKKDGDGGPGAQIMSSKAGEAEGVFKAGIGHYESNGGTKISATVKSSMDKLWSNMADSANNKLVIQVTGGKKDFANWYKERDHSRRKKLKEFKPTPTDKQIDAHLDAEMDLLGIPQMARNPEKTQLKLLQNLVDKRTKKPLFKAPGRFKPINSVADVSVVYKGRPSISSEYKKDDKWKIGKGQTKSGRKDKAAVIVNPDHLDSMGKVKRDALTTDANLKELITDVVETSIATKEWASDLEEFYKGDDELKKWFLYEAGSGLFKFTGTYSKGSPYTAAQSPVANKLVVFSESGVAKPPISILKWADTHTDALSEGHVEISYKTSKISGSAVIRLAAEYESELPLLQEELRKIESQYLLNEGVFSWVKDKVTVIIDKVRAAVKIFIENVIKKFVDYLIELAKKGHDLLMEALGIEGKVQIPIPSW